MLKLERLYDCAGKYLSGERPDWNAFAREFGAVFDSEMALYRSPQDAENFEFVSLDHLIATTRYSMMEQYFDQKIYLYDDIFDDLANPFEPIRRTDAMGDEEYVTHEVVQKFMLPNGAYHFMFVFAVLSDSALLVLFVWRDKEKGDFSDIEKQRLALFMRYLVTFVRLSDVEAGGNPDDDVTRFGQKFHLTEAETSVLGGLLEGKSLREIGKETARSYSTVRWHVQNILEKCHVKSQKNLLAEFYRLIKR